MVLFWDGHCDAHLYVPPHSMTDMAPAVGNAGGTTRIASPTPLPGGPHPGTDPPMTIRDLTISAQLRTTWKGCSSSRDPLVLAEGALACNAAGRLFHLVLLPSSPSSYTCGNQGHAFIIIVQAVSQHFLPKNPTCNTIF